MVTHSFPKSCTMSDIRQGVDNCDHQISIDPVYKNVGPDTNFQSVNKRILKTDNLVI